MKSVVVATPVAAAIRPSALGNNRRRIEREDVITRAKVSSGTSQAKSASYQIAEIVDDIDAKDKDDPLCVTEYVEDLYNYFLRKEMETFIRPTYMEGQTFIDERMRSILVDWLVDVHLAFKFVPEILYLTINLIDRYLERAEVTRPKLQLVGITSFFLASKYEGGKNPPELRNLVYLCDQAYTRQDVSCMAPLSAPLCRAML